tara:strand:+ start:3153 stop:3479 length:327 start_codon:yes stop_codon:yes gene_type:complete
MTIDFKLNAVSIGKINSKVSKELIDAKIESWIDVCDAIFVSCSDKADKVTEAKNTLVSFAQACKFEQLEPTEVESKYEGSKVFVCNKVPLKDVDDNTNYALNLIGRGN